MDLTLFHSFNLVQKHNEGMATLNIKKLTVNKGETSSRTEHHKDPNKCRKTPDLSLAKMSKVCTIVSKVSQESNLSDL